MFNSTLENIIKRENYIDHLSNEKISTLKTKQVLFKALEECPEYDFFPSNQIQNSNIFPQNMNSPTINLLKHILPAPQNSYQEIQQIQNRIRLLNDKKLNQVQLIKERFKSQYQAIKLSGLKVSDFLQIYENQDMRMQQKDLNDPLIKKIMSYFETNTKQHTLQDLLLMIIEGLSSEDEMNIKQQSSQSKKLKKIRQSVCSLQGFNFNVENVGDENKFNEEIRKEMDKTVGYYQGMLQIFDIQNQQ